MTRRAPRLPSGRDESLGPYLRDIQAVDLLSAAEEIELSHRIRAGDGEARERMIRANLRLVVAIAKTYAGRGLALSDLIEEGNVGLLKAVERFDPAAECRFSTYGSWWIKQSIRRALVNTARTVRVPSYMVEIIAKMKAASARLEKELGHAPTMEEIAGDLGLDGDGVDMLRRAMRAARSGRAAVSLESVVGEDGSIQDPRSPSAEDALAHSQEAERLQAMLDAIDPREAEVLRMRFGIDIEEPLTLREIGDRLGISRERVRQIESRALRKLGERMGPSGAQPSDAAEQ